VVGKIVANENRIPAASLFDSLIGSPWLKGIVSRRSIRTARAARVGAKASISIVS
jgi:hypothetical protein